MTTRPFHGPYECRTCGAACSADDWADCDTPVGVIRLFLCDDCYDERMPRLGWAESVLLAMDHPDYVG